MASGTRATLPAWVALAVLAAYGVACVGFFARDVFMPEWDSAVYVLLGRALALGEGYTYLGEPYFLRPPGIPWLLSWVMPDGEFDPLRVNRLMLLFVPTALAAIWFALSPRLGTWMALAVALLSGTHPMLVGLFNWIYAEFPFLTFLFLSMAFFERATSREGGGGSLAIAAAICLSVAIYLRSAGIVLLPGMLLLGWARRRERGLLRAVLPVLLCLALITPWFLWARLAAAGAETPVGQMLNYDYFSALFRADPGNPASPLVPVSAWIARITRNCQLSLLELAETSFGVPWAWLSVLVAVVLIVGPLVALRRGISILEWYTLAYVGMALTWLLYAYRLVIPLVPALYLYLFVLVAALASLAERVLRVGCVRPACASLFLLLFALNLLQLPIGLDVRNWASPGFLNSWSDSEAVARWIRENTASDAVLVSGRAPIYAALTGRRVYTYDFQHRFPGDPDRYRRYDPDFLIIDRPGPRSREFEARAAPPLRLQAVLPSRLRREGIRIYAPPPD